MNLYDRNGDPTLDTYLFAGLATALAFLSAYIGTTARDINDNYASVYLGLVSIATYCVALYVHSKGKLAEEKRAKRVIKRADYMSLKNPPKPKSKFKVEGLVIQCKSPACTNTFIETQRVGRRRMFCSAKCKSYTHNKLRTKARRARAR